MEFVVAVAAPFGMNKYQSRIYGRVVKRVGSLKPQESAHLGIKGNANAEEVARASKAALFATPYLFLRQLNGQLSVRYCPAGAPVDIVFYVSTTYPLRVNRVLAALVDFAVYEGVPVVVGLTWHCCPPNPKKLYARAVGLVNLFPTCRSVHDNYCTIYGGPECNLRRLVLSRHV